MTMSGGTLITNTTADAIVPGSPAEQEEFSYEGSIPLTTSVGHKLGSLAGIVLFVAVTFVTYVIFFLVPANPALGKVKTVAGMEAIAYHAGMDPESRLLALTHFQEQPSPVLVAME